MKSSLKPLLLAAIAAGFHSGASLFAAVLPVPVANPGFESPVLADGASIDQFSGWSSYANGLVYVWNPDAGFYANGVEEGQNVGDVYQSAAFSGFTQELQGALGQFQANTTYELKVKVGRNLADPYDGYIIQLVANDVVLAQDDNTRVPAAGAFVTSSLRYEYDAALHAALVGSPIEIRLLSKGLAGGSGDVNFDDVQLTYETTNAVAVHGGPYRLSEGATLVLNGSGSIPSNGGSSITNYQWDLDGDGDFDENVTGASPSIPYNTLTTTHAMELGVNTIGLRVTDNLSQVATSTTTVSIFALRTYQGPNTSNGTTERWNVTGNWTGAAVPSGLVDVVIPASKSPVPCLSPATPEFSGNLTLGANSQIQVSYSSTSPDIYNCLGTPGSTVMTMNSGSSLSFRAGGEPILPAIVLNANASITLGSSTQAGAAANFNHPITGNYRLSLYGNNTGTCIARLNAPNNFAELHTAGAPYVDGGLSIHCNVPGAISGNLTLTALGGGGNSGLLVINAADAISDESIVSMDGNSATKITLNANDTISRLIINGAQMPAGTYGSSSSTATYKQTWIAGSGILTVTDGQATYWDLNGTTAGAGGSAPAGTWDSGSANWTTSTAGTTATSSWVAGGNAVFAAGSDATGAYTVTLGGSNAITSTNLFTTSINTGTSSLNVTRAGWALNGGNCVAILVSSLNATGFTASYAGQAMTVQGVFQDSRNSYTGIAYLISDSLPATGDVVISVPYVKGPLNTAAYANMGTVYSIMSLSNVASAGSAVTRVFATAASSVSMTYTTSVNNSFVLGVASDANWQNVPKSVVGRCNQIISRAKPAYFNTIQCYGSVAAAGTYTDVYSPSLNALITLPFNAKTTSNPLIASAGQKISGVGFEEGTVTVASSALDLQANSTITSAAGVTGTISSQITGLTGAGIVKKGTGTLVLSSSANNYTGATSVQSGELRLGTSNALPDTVVTVAGNAPGITATLNLNNFNDTVAGLTLGGSSTTSGSAVTTGSGTLTLGGNLEFNNQNSPLGGTISGNLSLGSQVRTFNVKDSLAAANDLTVSASVSGSGGLSKIGLGTLVLSGNNSYTGATTAGGGLLVLSGSNASASGGITVSNNAAVRFDTPASINGTGENVLIEAGGLAFFGPSFGSANIPTALANRIDPASTGVVAVDNFAATDFNFLTSGLNVYLGALSNVTYSGTFTPNTGVYRIGGGLGTITLTGANALTGANSLLVGGGVIIANSNNLSGATTIHSTGRLQIGAGGTAGSLASSSAITNNGVLAFKRSDTLTQGAQFWSTISGSGALEQSGSGALVLNAGNTYTGGTNLVSGTLRLGHANALGNALPDKPLLTIYSGTLDVVSPGTLNLDADNEIVIGGSFSFGGTGNLNMGSGVVSNFTNATITLNGTGTQLVFDGTMSNASGNPQALTVNGAGNTLVLGGYELSSDIFAFNQSVTISGTGNVDIAGAVQDWSDPFLFDTRLGSLTKTGTGTLTLRGINNYTGSTVVSGGVLHLLNASPDSQQSHIIVNSGGTLAFTLGTAISSTNKLTLNPGHKVRIVGTPTLPLYTLMTASSITGGELTLETPIPGYFLEVAGNELRLTQQDTTPPVLNAADIVDNVNGGPVAPNTLVTYTLTFNEDIDHTTVTAADFDNEGTATITIGTITETSPGIFTVQITPTTAGTLQLRIPGTASITDVALPAGNMLAVPVSDDTTIEVADPNSSWLAGSDIVDDRDGTDVSPNTLVTYTVYFSRDIDHTTVSAADFDNAGDSSITIGSITEIAAGVFTVQVTPTTIGTLQLRIPTTAEIRDPSDNILDVDPAIADDTTIAVVSQFAEWAGQGVSFDDDQNGDGISNGLAWLLGADSPGDNVMDLMPTADEQAGEINMFFTTLKSSARGAASIKVQYSKDLGALDLWTNHQAEVPDVSGTDGPTGIVFEIQDLGGDFISVYARIPAAAAGTGKKLFSRVNATLPP